MIILGLVMWKNGFILLPNWRYVHICLLMYAPVCFTAQANFTRKADRLHIPAVLPWVFPRSVRYNSIFGRGSVDISSSECPRCCNDHEKVSHSLTNIWATLLSFILHSGFQPVGISIHVQHMAAEGQPVNQGCYHCGVLKQIEYSGGGVPPVRWNGNRRSGVLETVTPAIWEPPPRKGMLRLLSSGPSQIIRSDFYQVVSTDPLLYLIMASQLRHVFFLDY